MAQQLVGPFELGDDLLIVGVTLRVNVVAFELFQAGEQILGVLHLGPDKCFKLLKGVSARDQAVNTLAVDLKTMSGQ